MVAAEEPFFLVGKRGAEKGVLSQCYPSMLDGRGLGNSGQIHEDISKCRSLRGLVAARRNQ